MPDFFFDLGARAGRTLRQGKWLLQAFTGTDVELLAAEEAVGRDLAAEVVDQLVPDADPQARSWLDALGARLTACLKNKQRRFRFTLVAAGEPNAFALPGGFVFVERSLLELCGWSEAEAGFVIGHEIAHVVKGHALERMVGGQGLARLAGALPLGGPAGMVLRQVGLSFLNSAYSREQEFDADQFGARLAAAAGLEVAGGPRLLGRLAAVAEQEPEFTLFAYFASHPPLAERIARLRALLPRGGG